MSASPQMGKGKHICPVQHSLHGISKVPLITYKLNVTKSAHVQRKKCLVWYNMNAKKALKWDSSQGRVCFAVCKAFHQQFCKNKDIWTWSPFASMSTLQGVRNPKCWVGCSEGGRSFLNCKGGWVPCWPGARFWCCHWCHHVKGQN